MTQTVTPKIVSTRAENEKAWARQKLSNLLKKITARTVMWILLVVFLIFSVVPMIWLLLAPSKSSPDLIGMAPISFGSFEQYLIAWDNLMLFQEGRFVRWIWNSTWYTTLIVLFASSSAAFAGFALATAKLPFRRTLLIATLIAMIVPPVAFVLPLFVQISAMGLYNSAWAIILTSSFYPFGTFLAYIYYSTSIPKEVYDAARVDGCGEFTTFTRIALPLSKGLLGMLAFFSFTAAWINYFLPYVLVNQGEKLTLPVGLGILFSSTPALNPGVGATALPIRGPEIALAGLFVAIPILLVFLASARFLTRGMLAGAIKN